jgi:UPF0755 protein
MVMAIGGIFYSFGRINFFSLRVMGRTVSCIALNEVFWYSTGVDIKDCLISSKQRFIIVAAAGGVMVGTVLLLALWYLGLIFPPYPPQSGPVIITIEKGSTAREISETLAAKHLIRSPNVFLGYIKLIKHEAALRSGNFVFHPPVSIPTVLAAIKTGATEKEIKILEGWDVVDVALYLEKEGLFSKEDFIKAAHQYEGYLFPDTYRVFDDATPQDVIALMRGNFEKKAAAYYETEPRSVSLTEAVIMASMLEREAHTFPDQKIIAGIFWKRLNTGMPLQVDATLTYVTGRASLWLTKDDLAIDSGYNTYRNLGLPVGPIANPGLKSLEAALNPISSPFWFYLSDREGLLHYSATFDEHKQKKFTYLR